MVTPLYAALFALLLIALSVRTIRLRRRYQVAIGPGEDMALQRAMRVHANFCEYIPIALIGLFFVESLWGSGWWIHLLGLPLLLGRLSHAWGVQQVREDLRFRVFGMISTFTVIGCSALAIIAHYLLES